MRKIDFILFCQSNGLGCKIVFLIVCCCSKFPEPSGKLFYTIESGNANEQFAVDYNTGVVSVTDGLDYESKQHHQLVVRATDASGGGYAETIVLLEVTDVNDCKPKFVNDSYSARVSESTPVGTLVTKVKATDGDAGQEGKSVNSQVVYSLQDSEFFTVDPESGEVRPQNPNHF